MKYQLGTYQTTRGKMEITDIDKVCIIPYKVNYLEYQESGFDSIWETEGYLDSIIIDSGYVPTPYIPTSGNETNLVKPSTPEPLENWKHPYFGRPILVRDREEHKWIETAFSAYIPDDDYPVRTKIGGYKLYKFPESIELTQEELLQIAAEAKGVDVEQIKIKEQ